nr:uncharacterized protein [Tanacetum cinerariifolium]
MTNTQTPPPAPTDVNPTGAPITNTVANHAERLEKFNGRNFKRWKLKILFYLTTLGLVRFLKETVPQIEPPAEGQSSNAQVVQDVKAWKHSDFLCHNYVLNGLIDPLYKCTSRPRLPKNYGSNWNASTKQRMLGTCYNCDQPGHHVANCKMPKLVNPRQANMVNDDVDMIPMVSDRSAMIFKVNLVGTNHGGWWIDIGATRHVCADKTIKSEIDSILQNHTWELVDLPPSCKPLGYKWIFKKKMKADGTIDKYKA